MKSVEHYSLHRMSIGNVRTYQQIVRNLWISGGYVCGYRLISEN